MDTIVSLHQTDGERKNRAKRVQMSDGEKCCLFLQVPDVSLLFPAALRYGKCAILLQAETCDNPQNNKMNYKQNNNKTMGSFIMTDSRGRRLRNEILALAKTCHKAFGEQCRHADWL